jgi:DnaJ-class molecular chaperone
MAEDYYQTLAVKRDASQAEIQKAYREMARKHHPDLHPDDKNAKKKFQEVQAAFDVLNDPQKRELYDRYGSSFEQMAGGAGPQPGGRRAGRAGPGPSAEDFDFSQFFGDRFGAEGGGFADVFQQFTRAGGGGRARASRTAKARGEDLRHELEVPFLTAINGGQVEITLQHGDGRAENLAVKIPAGIDEGQTIRLRGKGGPSPTGNQAGDLLITIHVTPHPHYQRTGKNLLTRLPVTLAEAALGAKVDVPLPSGKKVSLRIPAGTSSGKKLRIKGQGVAPAKGEPGDLLAEVQIMIPAQLDEASQELVRQFDQRNPLDPRHEP